MGKFPRKAIGFRCLICDELFDEESDAEDCCREEKQDEVEVWQCVDCDSIYEDKDDAYSCCE